MAITSYQEPNDKLDYVRDWSGPTQDGADPLTASDWTVIPAGLTLSAESFDPVASTTTVWVEGGEPGDEFALTNEVTTQSGRRETEIWFIHIGRGGFITPPELRRLIPNRAEGYEDAELQEYIEAWKGEISQANGGVLVDNAVTRRIVREGASEDLYAEILRESGRLSEGATTGRQDRVQAMLARFDAATNSVEESNVEAPRAIVSEVPW